MSASPAWFQPSSEPPPPVPVPAADSSTCRPGNRPRMTARRLPMWPQTSPVSENHQADRTNSSAFLTPARINPKNQTAFKQPFHRFLFVGEDLYCDSTIDSDIFYKSCVSGVRAH